MRKEVRIMEGKEREEEMRGAKESQGLRRPELGVRNRLTVNGGSW